jgi:hypothetical protein
MLDAELHISLKRRFKHRTRILYSRLYFRLCCSRLYFPPWFAFPGVFLPKNSMDSCVPPPYAPPPSPRYYLALVPPPPFFWRQNTQRPPRAIVTLGDFAFLQAQSRRWVAAQKAGVANTQDSRFQKSPQETKNRSRKIKGQGV